MQTQIIFNGITFYKDNQSGYYSGRDGKRTLRLHVAVWEYHNNTLVPYKHHIHHMDFDKENNEIDNLECLHIRKHMALHAKRNYMLHPEECSNKCKSKNRRDSGVDNEIRICEYCGKEYSVNKYSTQVHCSRRCANINRVPFSVKGNIIE